MKRILSFFGIPSMILAAVIILLTGLPAARCSRENRAAESRDFMLGSESGSQVAPGSLPSKLEEYLRAAETEWGFQGSVLVAKGEKVILKRGIGAADRAENIPNTPGTKFLIASVTKVFTAAAVMKLAEERALRLEDPAVRYLPGYKDVLNENIKISHLLSHSSGLPEFSPEAAGRGKFTEPVEPRDLIAAIRGQKPLFRPGQEARYSNIGYIMLGQIIEDVTGKGYYDWIDSHLLQALGLDDSGMTTEYASRPDFARGYMEDGRGGLHPAPFIHPSWGYSAGALFSTVEDLYTWDRTLAGPGFLTADSLEKMFRPHNRNFSCGWLVDTVFGCRSIAHGGGAPGYSAWIERWPEEDVFTAILCNVTGMPCGELGRSLAAAVFGEAYAVPEKRTALAVKPEVLAEFTGSFRMEGGDSSEIVLDGESLFVIRTGSRFPIRPYLRDCFFLPTYKGAFLRFVRDVKGDVSGFISHELGVDKPASKIRK